MMEPQMTSDNPYLQQGDWIQLQYQNLFLFSDGFKSAQVSMKSTNDSPLNSLFIIQHVHHSTKTTKKYIHFNQPIILIHRFSFKYLSYTPNFANKSEFKLRSALTEHCQFILRPLYKCQTIRGNIVKNKEQCMLSPAISQYAAENINMVVGKFEKNTMGKVPIFLKKNEFTSLRINRKNLDDKKQGIVSNLQIYQLGHLQEKKWISCWKNTIDNTCSVIFTPENVGYDSLLSIQLYYDNPGEQIEIKKGDIVSLKFLGLKNYLAFNDYGEVYLSQQKTQQSRFRIQLYSNDKPLGKDSLIKIKHVKTDKYLSFNANTPSLEEFNAFNIYQLNHLTPQELKSNLFINEVYKGLQEEFEDMTNAKRKRGITSILKETLKFIFKNKNVYEEFLNLGHIKHHITEEQQRLFASIGFITLLNKMSIYFFEQFQISLASAQERKIKSMQNINSQYNEQEHIYLQTCIIMVGICKNNKENIIRFSDQIKIYYEHIAKIKGNIELLFHIYAFNTIALEIMENQQFTIKKYQIKAMQLLCEFLYKKEFPMQTRTKLIKLFHGCIINESNQKIYAHQQIMLSAFYGNKLKNIMLSLSNNQDYELIISLKAQKQELQSMIENEDNYQMELELLYQQLDLMTTLCSRASKKHLNLFRDIISEDMVKKYLKIRLNSKFKSLFLKILISIYLNKHLNLSPQALIVITNPKKDKDGTPLFRKFSDLSELSHKMLETNEQVEMSDVKQGKYKFMANLGLLNEIKQLVKTTIRSKLDKSQIESELICSLYAISSFLQVQICEERQGQEILKLLANYLNRCYLDKAQHDDDLVQKFIELLQHHLEYKIKQRISTLFLEIRQGYRDGQQRSKYSKKIVNACNQFMQRELLNLVHPQFLAILNKIIEHSVGLQSFSVFGKSSKLYHKIKNIKYHFLQMIKGSVPIESDSSHDVLKKINKLYNSLSDYTIEYIYYHDNTVQISNLRKNITHVVNETVELLQSHQEQEPINIIAQKMMGEFNFFNMIIELIHQREKDIQNDDSIQLFQAIFKFINLLFMDSDDNFFKNAKKLTKIKVLFKYQDRGQVRLLWNLTCMKTIRTRLNNFAFDCWLTAARKSQRTNIYIALGLLKLIEPNQDEVNQHNNVKSLIRLMLSDASILQQLLSHLSLSEEIFTPNYDSSYRQQWLFYHALVMKLLVMVYEQSKESNTSLLVCYRKYMPLKLLVKLIEQTLSLQFDNNQEDSKDIFLLISTKLIKQYLVGVFTLLYLTREKIQFEYLIYIAQRIAIRLTIKNSQMASDDYIYKNLMFYNKHTETQQRMKLREAIMDYLHFQNPTNLEIAPQDFHIYVNNIYLFINVHYDFLFKVCEKMIEMNLQREDNSTNVGSTVSSKEVDVFIENIFKRYKEFISQKLNYSEYASYWNAYGTSIKSAQEILKKKVGLNFNYQAHDQDGFSLLEGQEYFHNRQVSYVFKGYLQSKIKIEKYLFEAILIMTLNPHISVSTPLRNNDLGVKFKAILDVVLSKMKSQPGSFREMSMFLYSYILMDESAPQWQPSLEYLQLFKEITCPMEDMNSSNLKYYIFAQKKLLQNYLSFQANKYTRYKPIRFDNTEQYLQQFSQFKGKIKSLIEQQIKFHDRKLLMEQSIIYFQSKQLNYQIFPRHLSIQLVLEWLLLKIKYNVQNINRYYQLILSVITLLKAYTQFVDEFDKKYVTSELYHKINLCLKILFKSITGNNVRMLLLLIQQELWVELNSLLSLNDTLQQNIQELDLKAYDLIKLATRVKLDGLQNNYVQGVLQLYNNSISIYGHHAEILPPHSYPLLPIKSFFHQAKHLIAIMIKEFQHLPHNIATQFYSKLDSKYIDYNIVNGYDKFNYLYGIYTIATVYPELDYGGQKEEEIAYSLSVQNGALFATIRMFMDTLNGRYQLMNIFNKYRIETSKHQKLHNFLSTLRNFFIDFLFLFVNIFCSSRKREKSNYIQAITFFLTKISRIQIIFQQQIYVQQFMIYPQCTATRRMKQRFLGQLNFISNQLKRQSILLAIQRFNLSYQNQLKFFRKFYNIKLMLFMANYLQVLKNLSYLIVVVNNALLLANQIDVSNNTLQYVYPFYILALANFLFSFLILVVYCIKDLPLTLKIHKYELSQGIGYFGRKFNEKSEPRKKLILAFMIVTNLRLLYNLIYTLVVGLIFVNPIFASILLLDVLAHVPSIRTLLLSIWRPKYQLLLTMVAFVILQYFFSILIYFLFKSEASPYCEHLGECFTFIFLTTFKSIHGFVGYLFQQNPHIINRITIFSLLQDIYVILIYQIVIALILAIVIDSFTVDRAEKLKQVDNLTHACIVCNIEQSKFNIQSKLGFKGHVNISHNVFSYIDFKYGISIKPVDYLNDFELAVLGDKSSLWIPDGKTNDLEQQGGENSAKVNRQ